MNAQTIEARRAETSGSVEDESVVRVADAPNIFDSLPWSPRGFTLPGAFTAMDHLGVLLGKAIVFACVPVCIAIRLGGL